MIQVYYGGCHTRHPASFRMDRPGGISHHLLLFVKSASCFTIDGTVYNCAPNTAVLLKKGTPHIYFNPTGEYSDDWLHFDYDNEDLALFPEVLFNNPFPLPNAAMLSSYLQQLLWEYNYALASYRDKHIKNLMELIMDNLKSVYENQDARHYRPYYNRFCSLRLRLQSQPYKKVRSEELAAEFGISNSYFQHLYTEFFSISFQADLIQIRITYAKELIQNTDSTIEQIADSCGYSNEVHFYRQFRKLTGMTPKEYRSLHSS